MSIIDLIRSNPWLIFVIFWAVSSVGGVMQRVAKKADQQRRKQASQRSAELEGTQAPSRRQSAPQAEAPSRSARSGRSRPTADDIAAEIRRAMGQRDPEPVRRAAQTTPPPIQREPVEVQVVTERRKTLSEEMAEKEAKEKADRAREDRERQIHLGRLEGRDAHLGERISGRHLRPEFAGKRNVGSVRRGTPLVDLSRPASAFVAMELFGPPVGMRGPDGIGRPLG